MLLGTAMLAIGLFLYGWSLHYHTHWIYNWNGHRGIQHAIDETADGELPRRCIRTARDLCIGLIRKCYPLCLVWSNLSFSRPIIISTIGTRVGKLAVGIYYVGVCSAFHCALLARRRSKKGRVELHKTGDEMRNDILKNLRTISKGSFQYEIKINRKDKDRET